jgi:hypothetical protein
LAVIAHLISGTRRGAILGMDPHTPVTGDLTNDGALRAACHLRK